MRYYFIIMIVFGGGLGIVSFLICCIFKCSKMKRLYITLLASYIGALIAFTLLSGKATIDQAVNLIPFKYLFTALSRGNWYFVIQMAVNLFMFLPLGVFLRIAKKHAGISCLYGFLLSLAIELCEYFAVRGVFDIDDLILNTLGTLLGYIIARHMLDPLTAKKLTIAVILYFLLVIVLALSLIVLDRYYRDEMEKRDIVIWTPARIERLEGYDSDYVVSLEGKASYIYSVENDSGNRIVLELDEGQVRASGSGDVYSMFKKQYGSNGNWQRLESAGGDIYEYRNMYKAGNYLIIFLNEDKLITVPGLNEGIAINFERCQP